MQAKRYKRRRREILRKTLHSGIVGLLWRWHRVRRKREVPKSLYSEIGICLKKLLEDLGPTYVKLGQMLSTRQDILPRELACQLERLQDEVQPQDFSATEQTLEESFGKDWRKVFPEWSRVPFASASIAQVYRARLFSGEEVCVKIQRRGILEDVRLDIAIMEKVLYRYAGWFFPKNMVDVREIIQGFETQLYFEMDFQVEAQNIESFRRYHENDKYVSVPRVYNEWSNSVILTMEYMEGYGLKQIYRTHSAERRAEIARRLLYSYANQVFRDGYFHADPHPGNLKIQSEEHIVFLDFGIVGRLSNKNRYALLTLFWGITKNSPRIVTDALLQMHILSKADIAPSLERDIQSLLDKYLSRTLREVQISELVREFLQLLKTYRMQIPASLISLSKTFVIMEGVVQNLGLEQNILEISQPIARKLLWRFISKDYMTECILPSFYDSWVFLRDLPKSLVDWERNRSGGSLTPAGMENAKSNDIFMNQKDRAWLHFGWFAFSFHTALLTAILMSLFPNAFRSAWWHIFVWAMGIISVVLGMAWLRNYGRKNGIDKK